MQRKTRWIGSYTAALCLACLTPAYAGICNDPSNPDYLPDEAFRNPQDRTALRNKVEVVLQLIQRGDYAQALDKLENDILRKVDGCAASGAPDNDDWIVDCKYQEIVYQRVTRAIEALQVMLGEP